MSSLVKYEAARHALAEAHRVDEVKDIRDKAEAMAAYARQAKDKEMVKWVTEIKVRAERRAGQMLAEMQKNTGAKGTGSNQHEVRSHDVTAPKLADLGISKNESSRWQKLAGVSDEKFEHAIAAAKEVAGEVTTAAMLRSANPPTKKVVDITPAIDARKYEAMECELDAAHKELADLHKRIAIEALPEDERVTTAQIIESLEDENKQLRVRLQAAESQRDLYMSTCAEMERQIKYLQKRA